MLSRARTDDDGARPAEGAPARRPAGAAAGRPRRQIRPREDPRRGGQPGEVRIPRQYEPRAAHAAQRHHRLLARSWKAANVRPARLRQISRILRATSTAAASTCSTSSTTFSTCRRSRPAACSSNSRRFELDAMLDEVDAAGAGRAPIEGHVTIERRCRRRPRMLRPTGAPSSRCSSTCCPTP